MSHPVIGTPWKRLDGAVPEQELEGVERYWRCANYLSVGQIYLRSNPLMRADYPDAKTGEPRDFGRVDVKHRLVGHWGTTPGINFLFAHVNRLIADHGQNTIFLMGPGHGGPAGTAQSLLDGTYREIRPDITNDEAGLEKFFRQLGVFRAKASSVMIVGASKMCYYLASELLDMGMSVKIIDQNEQRCETMSEKLPKALVIVGDGTDSELLSEEGIGQTDAFVAITGLDEANILMALSAAKQSGDCCKVVAKINRKSLLDLVSNESMIDSVVSTGAVTTELILQYIRAMKNAAASKVKTLHRIVDEKVEALEFNVTPDISFVNTPLRDLKLRRGLLLAGIVRQNGQIIIPSGNDVLHLHDDVIVVTTDTQLEDLRDILEA